jgi:hypothetical protein
MKRSIMLLILGVIIAASVSARPELHMGWMDKITLFKSTKMDVEKSFGKGTGQNYGAMYKLKDGILDLEYYRFDHCKDRDELSADWKLPEWTVVEIKYHFDNQVKLSSLNLDLKKFRKQRESPDVPQLVSYVNDEDGVDYTLLPNGNLNSVRYFPGLRYEGFRCRK